MHTAANQVGSSQLPLRNALTIDVEDWFQVSAFERHIDRKDWASLSSRIDGNMERILALLDAYKVRATFFTLGWIAERYPHLIREIVNHQHELASHGYAHVRITQQDQQAFAQDIHRAKLLLEDLGGVEVKGYRAPSYSITHSTPWAHEELQKAGYRYSSSIYPIRHDLYGMPDAPRFPYYPLLGNDTFVEIPITTIEVLQQRIPCTGGGWFRLYPYRLSRWAIAHVNRKESQPVVFYFHPWEIDPAQPRPKRVTLKTKFRHYLNLQRTEARLQRLLLDFAWDRMDHVFFA